MSRDSSHWETMVAIVVAILPILILAVMLFGFGWRLVSAAPIAFLVATFAAMGWWSTPFTHILAALLKGAFLSIDIVLIVFGAIFFIGYLRHLGLINEFEARLRSLSSDRRIQAILLAWLFGSFIEGTAGFGTPAVVVAPLLVGIGFPAITAVMISLVANSTAVAFGAVGTPIRIGFSGLDVTDVAVNAAWINLFAGFVVPIFVLYYVSKLQLRNQLHDFLKGVPWAVFAGAAFLGPYVLFSYLGQEFPSLLGAAVGLCIAGLSIKLKFLVPKSTVDISRVRSEGSKFVEQRSGVRFSRPLIPYVALLIILVIGKFAFGRVQYRWNLDGDLSHTFQAFNPGFAFLTVILLLALIYRTSTKTLFRLALSTVKPLGKTAVSIFFVSATTYTMIVTSADGNMGMMDTISRVIISPWLPVYSPFIGALGAFMAGSATVSNLLFGSIQAEAALQTQREVSWILGLQLVGAGAGNMIALPNLLAVQAAVGISGEESYLLRRLIFPCFLYLAVASLVAVALMMN